MRQLNAALVSAFAVGALAAACAIPHEDKSDPANGSGNTDNWAFTMSASKANGFTIKQGSTDTLIVTITRSGGFTGAVNLQTFTQGGFTVTTEPITTTGVVTTSRVIIAVPGSFPVISDIILPIHGEPASSQVMGVDLNVVFSTIRKDGVFINVVNALSIGKGQAFNTRVSIIRTNFTAAVPFNLVNAPAGVTATFNPNPVTDTVTTMTLNIDASTAEGVYNLGVRGNEGLGLLQSTAPLALTVTPPGTVAMSFTTNPLTVLAGGSTPTTINLTRTNYPGAVSVSASGLPPGLNVALPPPVPNNSFTATFNALPSTAAGSYPITFTLSGTGLAPVTGVLTVIVSK
jgi:hypothetical protein